MICLSWHRFFSVIIKLRQGLVCCMAPWCLRWMMSPFSVTVASVICMGTVPGLQKLSMVWGVCAFNRSVSRPAAAAKKRAAPAPAVLSFAKRCSKHQALSRSSMLLSIVLTSEGGLEACQNFQDTDWKTELGVDASLVVREARTNEGLDGTCSSRR